MSLTSIPDEIAAAVTTVPGVKGHVVRPGAPNVGDAWSLLSTAARMSGTAFLVAWYVRVLVPQDEGAARVWFQERWPALFEALSPVGWVSEFEPIIVPTGAGDMYAFQITIQTED